MTLDKFTIKAQEAVQQALLNVNSTAITTTSCMGYGPF